MSDPNTSRQTLDYSRPQPRQRLNKRPLLWIVGILFSFAFAIALLLPQLGKAREPASRVKCASNLEQIGIALQSYANTHQARLPASLGELLAEEDLTSNVFVCPSCPDTPATGATTQQVVGALSRPGHCSYIYLGAGQSGTNDPDLVLAYEPLANHKNAGMNVLFGDWHVEFLAAPGVLPWIAAARGGAVIRPAAIAQPVASRPSQTGAK